MFLELLNIFAIIRFYVGRGKNVYRNVAFDITNIEIYNYILCIFFFKKSGLKSRPWGSKRFMAYGHTAYCGLVRGPRVEK